MSQRVITIGRLQRFPAMGDLASDAADAFAGFADDTSDAPDDTDYDDTGSDDGTDDGSDGGSSSYDDGSGYDDAGASDEDTSTDAGASSGLLSSVTSSLPASLTTGSVSYTQIAMWAAGALLLAAGATYLLGTKGGSKWLDL